MLNLDRVPKGAWFALAICFLIAFVFVVGWSSAQPPHHVTTRQPHTAPRIKHFKISLPRRLPITRRCWLGSLAFWPFRPSDSGARLILPCATPKKTAEHQLRAYIGIDNQEVGLEKDKLVVFVDYRNGGQTPAHDVYLQLSAKTYDFALNPPCEPPSTPEDEGKGGV